MSGVRCRGRSLIVVKRSKKRTSRAGQVTQAALAKLFGIDVRTIRRWTTDGMPHEGKSGRAILYDVAVCIAWRREEDRKEAEDLRHPKTLEEARTRKVAAEAELAELDLMERRGELGTVEEMDEVITTGFGRMRALGMGIPSRHARDFVGLKTVTAARNALRGLIAELFGAFHRMGESDEAA